MSNKNGLEWEEPPASNYGRQRIDHRAVAAELRKHPGEWAKIAVGAQRMAHEIKAGIMVAYRPAGSFEAVSRNARPTEGRKTLVADIYVRYIGDGRNGHA
jgi:hypothetical protein